jgi:hypothetical protein
MIDQQKQVKARSRRIANEYLRVGWEMVSPSRSTTDDESGECLLFWPGGGAPVQPDWSQLEQLSDQNQRIA